MIIERISNLSQELNYMKIDITQEQLDRVDNRYNTGELIQDIVPDIPKEQREFLISGISLQEQQMLFGIC